MYLTLTTTNLKIFFSLETPFWFSCLRDYIHSLYWQVSNYKLLAQISYLSSRLIFPSPTMYFHLLVFWALQMHHNWTCSPSDFCHLMAPLSTKPKSGLSSYYPGISYPDSNYHWFLPFWNFLNLTFSIPCWSHSHLSFEFCSSFLILYLWSYHNPFFTTTSRMSFPKFLILLFTSGTRPRPSAWHPSFSGMGLSQSQLLLHTYHPLDRLNSLVL